MSMNVMIAGIVLALSSAMAIAQGWDFSVDEVAALRSGTLRYAIEKPGSLVLDMCSRSEGEFDRLEVIALKNEQGQPALPYRIRMFTGEVVRESAVVPHKNLTWNNPVEMFFLDQNPFPSIKSIGGSGDDGKAVSDGIARVEEENGRRKVTLLSSRFDDGFLVLNVPRDGSRDAIPGLGVRIVPQWPIFDDGLMLRQRHSELMRSDAKFFKFFPTKKYICSWAMYEVEEPNSGWVESSTGKEHPFVIRVRVWRSEDEPTRANALCIARVVGCAKINGNDVLKIDYEKGREDFTVKMLKGSLGESSRTLQMRYKNAESSVCISPDMSKEELMDLEGKFKDDCRKRIETKSAKSVK